MTQTLAAAPKMLVKPNGKPVTVSPSSLMDFIKSPHLFYLDRKLGLSWPRGAFPSLPDGMDDALKRHYDAWRATGLPPEVRGFKVPGRPHPDQALVTRLRTRGKKGLAPVVVTATVGGVVYGITFQGEMDDLLLCDDGTVAVPDFKTKGTAPEAGYTEKWYSTQLDAYGYILERQPLVDGKAQFVLHPYAYAFYYYPEAAGASAEDGRIHFGFKAHVERVSCSPRRTAALLDEVVRTLAAPTPPLLMDGPTDERLAEKQNFLKEYIGFQTRPLPA